MKRLLATLSLFFWMHGCTDSFVGEYSDPTTVEIVDDKFNETDQRNIALELIHSMLKSQDLLDFKTKHGKKPTVMIGEFENRSNEHIDLKAMVETIRKELIKSNLVDFMNTDARAFLSKEKNYQQSSGMVSKEEQIKAGQQAGANYLLTGQMAVQVHFNSMKNIKTVTYKFTGDLTDVNTLKYVWTDDKEVKKRFKSSSFSS